MEIIKLNTKIKYTKEYTNIIIKLFEKKNKEPKKLENNIYNNRKYVPYLFRCSS